MRPPSHDPYIRIASPYYTWSRAETSSSATTGSSYSTIDILRESKQASESVKPAKLLTTSGVFYPERQQTAPPPSSSSVHPPAPPLPPATTSIKNQSDAVDHHFRMALSNNRSNALPEQPPIPLVDLTGDKKNIDDRKYPHSLPNHTTAVHRGVSSCSSSSSMSSASLFDREANSPGRKPFPLPPPKSENRINNEACRFSLKKRLIQRYQADATTELASDTVSAKQEITPDQQAQVVIKQEPGSTPATLPEVSSSSLVCSFLFSNNSFEVSLFM